MDVRIEGVEGQIGNKGVLLRISSPNDGPAVGRLWIGKAQLKWYPGKTSKHCKSVTMDKFINWLDSR